MMEEAVIDFTVPKGWDEMSQEQIRFFFRMMNECVAMEAVITRCFLQWGGLKVVGRNSRLDFLLRKANTFFAISPVDLWQLMKPLWWMSEQPKSPVVLLKYGRHKAVDALFRGVPFETYLSCVSVWAELMRTGDPAMARIDDLINALYGFRPKKIKPEYLGCAIYWMSALQDFFAGKFNNLFAPVSSDGQGSLGSVQTFTDSMNAMIRALTKGDILKEKEVLACDTWRALVELDAQAKEAREICEKLKSNE